MCEESAEDRQLAEAIADADLRVLLMCLFQITGDHAWLEPPYTPARDTRLVPDQDAQLPPDVCRRIRTTALDMLRGGTPSRADAAIPAPSQDLFREMMTVCLGEQVPQEYVPMMLAELGFASVAPDWRSPDGPPEKAAPEVIIVGAGLSGIALGAQLTRLGIPYRILEKNDEVGGTWWENVYPGAGVDTPNHAYSFSHGPRYHWSRFFALRDEIHDYIVKCADEFGVRSNIEFRCAATGATWHESAQTWAVQARRRDGSTFTLRAPVLVTAVGILNTPKVPDIPGLAGFIGKAFHSARWPDVDLTGQNVAIVGTGATAMQLVPSLAGVAAELTVFQRSPQWIRPVAGYRDDMPAGTAILLDRMPFYQEWLRFSMFWRYGDGLLKSLYVDPDWPHPERAVNRRNDLHRAELTAFIMDELEGRPDLQTACLPTYPPFGKRILIDNGWYQALRRPNVALVPSAVDRIEGAEVVAEDGTRRPADVLVFATGFDVSKLAATLDIRGRGGVCLADAWANENPTAYLGMTAPNFPNMFCVLGPNSGLGHGGSTIFQSECQARYIAACLIEMTERKVTSMEVRQNAHDRYINAVDDEHAKLIWKHSGMTNWYRNAAGRITAIMPWRLVDFWHMTRQPDFDDYHFA